MKAALHDDCAEKAYIKLLRVIIDMYLMIHNTFISVCPADFLSFGFRTFIS